MLSETEAGARPHAVAAPDISMSNSLTARLYGRLSGAARDGGGRPGKAEARNGLIHIAALSATKLADGLIDPKLVLAWLVNALGAGGLVVGLLVPVREAGSLLPQMVLTRWLHLARTRKRFWALGSALQGLAALAIAAVAFLLEGAAAGWAVLGCLALLAVARAACSISHKDALARTIPKGRRGSLSGAAGSVASTLVLSFAALLALGVVPLSVTAIALAVAVAGGLWLFAAAVFLGLEERERDENSDGQDLASLVTPLRDDPMLRRFIGARALLAATAFAPPFIVMLSSGDGAEGEASLGTLGPLMIASAAASILSAYAWGRLSDRSSRLTLIGAGLTAAAALAIAAGAGLATGGLGGVAGAVAAIFAAQIAYEGVRIGRKTHLTDMADDDERARYTALSNTVIGGVLLLGGGFGLLAEWAGPAWTLAALALMCLAATPFAYALEEVQVEVKANAETQAEEG